LKGESWPETDAVEFLRICAKRVTPTWTCI